MEDVQNVIIDGYKTGSVKALGQQAITREAGVRLSGDLDCAIPDKPGKDGSLPVRCTGRTTGGEQVTFVGTATGVNYRGPGAVSAVGVFTATIGGKQVFRRTCLGEC
ncbi:MAG: hypothetical protein ABIS86_05305 [Streptosporangiaceae bacterium]